MVKNTQLSTRRFFHRSRIAAILLVLVTALLYSCDKKSDDLSQTESQTGTDTSQATKESVKTPSLAEEQPGMVETIQQADEDASPAAPSWSQHLQSYSLGWVTAEEPLRIRFAHDVIEEERLSQPIEGLVSVSPHIDLVATFTSTNELILNHPRLSSGQIYALQLHPEKLQDIPNELGPFNFQIQALVQDYELNVSGLVPGSEKNTMQLKGTIKTTDTADAEKIEASISLQQDTQNLPIEWQHSSDKLSHEFVIKNIQRGEQSQQIELVYSAMDLGVKKQGTFPIDVPAYNQFIITSVRTIQRPEQYVEVSFSEALDRKQNLAGLIRLDGFEVSTRIDGSFLRIYPTAQESGLLKLEIDDTIKSAKSLQLPEKYNTEVTFISELPGVRFAGKGSIIPPTSSLSVPIQAINVNAIYVTAFKVYEKNIPQYLQRHNVTSESVDTRTGRYLWRKKISLPSVPFDKWQHYDIDMQDIQDKHGDGIINLTISIDRSTIAFNCPNNGEAPEEKKTKKLRRARYARKQRATSVVLSILLRK